jgi:hypothetical protein
MSQATLEQKKAAIQKLLATNDRAVDRALIRIYERQTQDEKSAETTNHSNGRGFTGADAPFLTRLAKSCLRYNGLTEKQRYYVRRKIAKYWRQLVEVAEANGRPVVR